MAPTKSISASIPRGPGHCDDESSWQEFVRQYDGRPRSFGHLTDFALANAVFLAGRDDLDLIVYQTAAKERIRWLSIELAKALTASADSLTGRIAELEEDKEQLLLALEAACDLPAARAINTIRAGIQQARAATRVAPK